MIKSRPIIFSGEMVRAILEGRKTQARRVIKVQPSREDMQIITLLDSTSKNDRKNIGKCHWVKLDELRVVIDDGVYFSCPYKVGDHLWVKETWHPESSKPDGSAAYKADVDYDTSDCKWKSPLFMPRSASRITLEITSVRVERLNDISEEDAIAEGIEMVGGNYSCSPWRNYELKARDKIKHHFSSPIRSYQTLLESLHGKGSWDENPWVWVLEFRRV